MQTFSSAPVRLLPRFVCARFVCARFVCARLVCTRLVCALLFASSLAFAAPPKTHLVALGAVRKVPYTPPESAATSDKIAAASDKTGAPSGETDKPAGALTLKVRSLTLDGRQKEWTTGEAHDVTDRSFTIRRAMRLNDSLPGDTAARWSWQPGPWLLVDRTTGRITALHLPDFDNNISEAVWFRDYAAYCGSAATVKGGLFALVAQLGARRAVVQKQIGKWPQPAPVLPVCKPAQWQRSPLRVTLQPTGADPMTFDVVGAASLIEEGDPTPADDN